MIITLYTIAVQVYSKACRTYIAPERAPRVVWLLTELGRAPGERVVRFVSTMK